MQSTPVPNAIDLARLFDTYMERVNHYLLKYVGCTDLDLEDWSYASDFEAGISALQCAKRAIDWSLDGLSIDSFSELTEAVSESARYQFDRRLNIK